MKFQITNFNIKIEDKDNLKSIVLKKYRLDSNIIKDFFIQKESVDARDKSNIKLSYNIILDLDDKITFVKGNGIKPYLNKDSNIDTPKVTSLNRPIVVGFGPSGIFSALYLAECNLAPIILERGSEMDKRIKDVEEFLDNKNLNPNSNIQFGEGGAGTFSDGKLTTNTNDSLINYILKVFVRFGAPKEILYESMPHIGTDYLRVVIKNIREYLKELGASFYFNTVFESFDSTNDVITVKTSKETFKTNHLILALGHSARDTFKMLYDKGVSMEAKSFSMGVRVEHKRETINKIQFGPAHKVLPPASYKLAVHLQDRSVYTFCMCPGGEVMASASDNETIVTNGMSYYKRDKENSNAALLVNVDPKDYYKNSPLDGMYYQEIYEKKAFEISKDYRAPANLMKEFMNGEVALNSRSVNPSYPHGVIYTDLANVLPSYVISSIKEAIPLLNKKMHGFYDNDAVLTGVETRSSSPVRILRNENKESNIKGIYPVGEGAGYAGGIMTAALDGLKTAIDIVSKLKLN